MALELDPENVNTNGNYATFLYDIRKDNVAALHYFEKVLGLSPDDKVWKEICGLYKNKINNGNLGKPNAVKKKARK
jgi:hypothetical protein